MKSFTYVTKFGKYENCYFESNHYRNGNNALSIYNDEDGTIVVCSVNGSRLNLPDEIGIKNWSENIGVDKFLIEMGIIEKDPIDFEESGFVSIPYYKLTLKGMELFK